CGGSSPALHATREAHVLDTVAIVTADRPLALTRALHALDQDRERPCRVIVVDGSSANGTATRDALATVHGATPVMCIGAHEAAALRQRLASGGVPMTILDFGLTPGSIGSGRNLAALLAAGRPLLMQDDDVVAK